MGTWGSGAFSNDSALDLIDEIIDGGGIPSVEAALDRVIEAGSDDLQAPEGEQGLAAGAIVARLAGRDAGSALPEDLATWIEAARPDFDRALLDKARGAIERILAAESELADLWAESEKTDEWRAAAETLRDRL